MDGAAEFGTSAIARTATGCHTLVIGAQVRASLYRRQNSIVAGTVGLWNGIGHRLYQRGRSGGHLVPVAMRAAAGAALSLLYGRRFGRRFPRQCGYDGA